VLVGQHRLGIDTLQQAPADEGAQDASAQGGLHLSHGIRINAAGRVTFAVAFLNMSGCCSERSLTLGEMAL